MVRRLACRVACLTIALIPGALTQHRSPAAEPASPFSQFVDDYFDACFAWKPSDGTSAGFHQYDSCLEDRSAAAIAKRIDACKQSLQRLDALRRTNLSSDDTIDAEIIDGLLRAEVLDLETIGNWRKNPMAYISGPARAIDLIIKRDFAPAAERLRSVIGRLKGAPALYAAARANVEHPPHEFSDVAIRSGQGSIGFFHDSLTAWARQAAAGDAELLKEFAAGNAAAVRSLEETVAWLKNDLLPRSNGSYAIGADNFAKLLQYEEMVDIPLPRLLAIGEANLKRDHDAFVAIAKQIDPTKAPAQVMRALAQDHPTEDGLIASAKRTIEKARQFLIDKHVITIPSEVRPIVTEAPPFARNGGVASMDTPGAYEAKATEAFYYVTPPDKDWDAKRKEEHLRLYNAPALQIITLHEAFPGHFVQLLYAKQVPTKTRKLIYCGSNVEGWAHYGEQMAVEEGYGNGDLTIRLAQLSEALVRDCRYVVGIKLHTQGMTVEEGAKVFEKQAFREPVWAYREARRGTYNPTYLYYTLGKLQIYKLREDYRKMRRETFRLEAFHNEFVRQGGLPIKLIRRILLPGDTGPTL